MERYRNPAIRYRELRNAPVYEPENLVEGYTKLSEIQVHNLAARLANYGVTSESPAINLSPQEDHAAQKWIALKKKQIAHLAAINPEFYQDVGQILGLLDDVSYNIRQSGNLTRVAALLYQNSTFKNQVQQYSELKKTRRKRYLESHPRLQANLKALHFAERPLRNELYEIEQIDQAEFPEAATYLKGHALNYRLPTHQTMQKIASHNAIPVFPENAAVPAYIREYGTRQQNPPQLLPEDFRFEYVKARKGKRVLPTRLKDAMEYAEAANDDARIAIRQEIRDMLSRIRRNETTVEEVNADHIYAQVQPQYQYQIQQI